MRMLSACVIDAINKNESRCFPVRLLRVRAWASSRRRVRETSRST